MTNVLQVRANTANHICVLCLQQTQQHMKAQKDFYQTRMVGDLNLAGQLF